MYRISLKKEDQTRVIQFTIYGLLFNLLLSIAVAAFIYYFVVSFVIPIVRVTDTVALTMYCYLNDDKK